MKREKVLQKERMRVLRAMPRTVARETRRLEKVNTLKLLKNIPTLVMMMAMVLMMDS